MHHGPIDQIDYSLGSCCPYRVIVRLVLRLVGIGHPGDQKTGRSSLPGNHASHKQGHFNPAFFLIFFGSLILLSMASINEIHSSKLAFGLLLGSAITYLIGTVGITGIGNVPLNEQLHVLKLAEMNAEPITPHPNRFRSAFVCVVVRLSVRKSFGKSREPGSVA